MAVQWTADQRFTIIAHLSHKIEPMQPIVFYIKLSSAIESLACHDVGIIDNNIRNLEAVLPNWREILSQ